MHENPSTDDVAAGVEVARQFQPDLLVGLGGGSSMDCAKGINFLYTNGGQMQDYWGVGKAQQPMLPMIAVPTTAGTGSEAQSFALISDAQTHVKMACGDKKAACRVALLDPRLTLTQPPRVTALTGIDALAHALETLVTNKWTPDFAAVQPRSLAPCWPSNFARVLEDPTTWRRGATCNWAPAWPGLAIENSMLGAAHGLANPLTAHYGIVHGQAVGLMLPHVIRFNAAECRATYMQLLRQSDNGSDQSPAAHPGKERKVWPSSSPTDGPSRLGTSTVSMRVERSVLPKLAADAARQWTTSSIPGRPTPPRCWICTARHSDTIEVSRCRAGSKHHQVFDSLP